MRCSMCILITYPMPSAFVSLVFGGQQPGAGPTFKYDAGPVRRRADRQKLPGWSCAVCKEVGVGGAVLLDERKLGMGYRVLCRKWGMDMAIENLLFPTL